MNRQAMTLAALAAGLCASGCAANRPALRASLEPLLLSEAQPAAVRAVAAEAGGGAADSDRANERLTQNPFLGDATSSVSESFLRAALDEPVELQERLRVGVVTVVGRYEPDLDVSTFAVPSHLTATLERTGKFDLATEVASDFPAERGVSGLRELAARYRTRYLLLYRHRFVEDSYLNPIAWSFVTGVGALFMPGNTLESAGIVEASLFDVKTGAVLFTVNERVYASSAENLWNEKRKQRWLKERMLKEASERLSRQVSLSVDRLAARAPRGENGAGAAAAVEGE